MKSPALTEATHNITHTLGHTIPVPIDYNAPHSGYEELYYEYGAAFDKTKPTVFIIADAQQFYVRRGSIPELQRTLFGDAFNVVGIVNRGATPAFLQATLTEEQEPDWLNAWRIFNSTQYVDDIEAVRRAVVGETGTILLYGQSGGALLVHEYLSRYGSHVSRTFTPAALNPFIDGQLGFNSDRFWQEIGDYDPVLQSLMQHILTRRAADRETLATTFQRQHFFVPPDQLPAARADLIHSLASGDEARYEEVKKQYQVTDIQQMKNAVTGIPIRVRLYEFFLPSESRRTMQSGAFYPDLESKAYFAQPLLALYDAGKIPAPQFDLAALHRVTADVFILAARNDHTVDYRSSIALAYSYPEHGVLVVNDNHVFSRLKADGSYSRLLQTFLQQGLTASAFQDAVSATASHRRDTL